MAKCTLLNVFIENKYLTEQFFDRSSNNKKARKLMVEVIKVIGDAELTNKQRFCINEYYIKKRHVNEIAIDLGVTPSTVYSHLKSSRKKLKKAIKYYIAIKKTYNNFDDEKEAS